MQCPIDPHSAGQCKQCKPKLCKQCKQCKPKLPHSQMALEKIPKQNKLIWVSRSRLTMKINLKTKLFCQHLSSFLSIMYPVVSFHMDKKEKKIKRDLAHFWDHIRRCAKEFFFPESFSGRKTLLKTDIFVWILA